jgi:menaquinone-specific isochorismate synthase
MALIAEQIRVSELSQALPAMAELMESTLAVSSVEQFESRPIRLSVGLPAMDPLHWLAGQTATDRLYWSDRAGAFEMAGIGVADQINANPGDVPGTELSRLRKKLTPECEPARNGQSRFVCNLAPHTDRERRAELIRALKNVTFTIDDSSPISPSQIGRIDLPDRTAWQAGVEAILKAVNDDQLSKVVLARRTTLEFDVAPDPLRLLRHLKARSTGCFHFCFQFSGSTTFVGASPERLYRRVGRHIESEAVAGTRPRGATSDEDTRMSRELLASEKDVTEHAFVVNDIARVLKQICRQWRTVEGDAAGSLMKLARVQHLVTRLEGELADGYDDSAILTSLHPTSAVGGVPTSGAIPMIEKLEPFDRGWYAAPVGWVGNDAAEFAVGIRSGLVDGHKLHLYSGAGIVQGSSAEEEWREIDSKLSGFLAALN